MEREKDRKSWGVTHKCIFVDNRLRPVTKVGGVLSLVVWTNKDGTKCFPCTGQ